MALSTRLRFEILRRDNYACRYCGAKAPFVELHVDHVIPRSHGGTDDRWNLTAACVACNLGKSNGIPDNAIIREVREDEATHQACMGLDVLPCMYCARPVQREPEDEDYFTGAGELIIQCEPCNVMVCDAYEAGFGRRLGHHG